MVLTPRIFNTIFSLPSESPNPLTSQIHCDMLFQSLVFQIKRATQLKARCGNKMEWINVKIWKDAGEQKIIIVNFQIKLMNVEEENPRLTLFTITFLPSCATVCFHVCGKALLHCRFWHTDTNTCRKISAANKHTDFSPYQFSWLFWVENTNNSKSCGICENLFLTKWQLSTLVPSYLLFPSYFLLPADSSPRSFPMALIQHHLHFPSPILNPLSLPNIPNAPSTATLPGLRLLSPTYSNPRLQHFQSPAISSTLLV